MAHLQPPAFFLTVLGDCLQLVKNRVDDVDVVSANSLSFACLLKFSRERDMTPRCPPLAVVTVAALALLLPAGGIRAFQQRAVSAKWITAWGSSQDGLAVSPVTNATIRMIARVTISGGAIRIRLDNTFGTAPLLIGKAYVGQRIQGATLAEGSNRQVSFNTSASVQIQPGRSG